LSPVVLIVLIIAVLGLGVFALNHFGVIHLWGKKPVQVTETFPEPTLLEPTIPEAAAQPQPAEAQAPPGGAAPTPSAAEATPQVAPPAHKPTSTAPAPAITPPSGTGNYTIQVSSWASRAKAEAEAGRLGSAGLNAYVEEGIVGGTTWYRVRVGRYATEREAKEAIAKMQPGMETDLWVTRVGH
jgi:cell division protein FtsN